MSRSLPRITEKDIPYIKHLLSQNKTFSEIGEIYGINYRTVSYYIRKLGLFTFTNQYVKECNTLHNEFEIIDTPEKAYTLGFLLGDGGFGATQDIMIVGIAIKDKEVLDFISKVVKGNVIESLKLDRAKRIFPHVTIAKTIPHLVKHFGGRLKKERHYPRINNSLERYLLLGFFDADGGISYGNRKDRGRFWVNISFTNHLKCLTGLQKLLYRKLGISTIIHPKSDEDAYVIKFSGKEDVIKFINYIYPDESFIVLKRKYEKAKAVRLELGEIGETANGTIPSRAINRNSVNRRCRD